MSDSIGEVRPSVWQISSQFWIYIAVIAALLGVTFYVGIKEMMRIWNILEEYSYGYLIPFITAFLIWQKKHILERTEFSGSWVGVAIVIAGLPIYYLGSLSTITTLVQYALLIVLIGAMLAVMGWKAFKPIFVPVLFLIFMIPLPVFFLNNLSSHLQLISSQLGVDVTRLFGVSVYLEGNVIDLGTMKLQVVEACSGLRYLFPLMSLAFICAYIYRGAFWKRAVIFISSIPITVLMNSLRIGIIGVLVEYRGPAQAQGFLHDFEGWVVFMACLGIILGEIWIFARIGKNKQTLREAFNLDFPDPSPSGAEVRKRKLPRQSQAVGVLLLATAVSSYFLVARAEIHPQRMDFGSFPLKLGDWQGNRSYMEKIYLDALKLDDYILADFTNSGGNLVNLYVAYYASQRAGESAHSPRSCIPGGGWQIKTSTIYKVDGVVIRDAPLIVNRMVIQKGENKELVYYWFQQRGRIITNEYMVKWYLFRDALSRDRTDGALVRLITAVPRGGDETAADKQLTEFAKGVTGTLQSYIPD